MATTKEWKWGYIDRTGEFVIPPAYDDARDFHEDLAVVKIDWARGYIDKEGLFVIPPRFEKAGPFIKGVAQVTEDGEVRYVDREGKYVEAPADYLSADYETSSHDEALLKEYFDAGNYSEGLAPVKKSQSGKWGYIDEAGKKVIPFIFRQAGDFHEGLARVLTQI
ncbi:MAG: WG repeat-containing protein [Muribaculaceae bacterium]|nr:WG repeat-containing protein [Muribaculaceae bacterium]